MVCRNCNSVLETAFCPACGQQRDIHRISVGHIAHEGFHSITHADKGFLLLVKELLSRPGFIAREYIEGKRKRYFNPFSFLVISSALFAYFGGITGFMDKLTAPSAAAKSRPLSAEWMEAFHIASSSGKWLILLLIAPLFSFLSWLFFFKKKYNYAENFVLHSFIFGEAALFRLLIPLPLFLIVPEKTALLNLIVYEVPFLIFLIVAYKQFFQQHIAFTITKAIIIRLLFIVLFWGLILGYVILKNLLI